MEPACLQNGGNILSMTKAREDFNQTDQMGQLFSLWGEGLGALRRSGGLGGEGGRRIFRILMFPM
jgi:hypothetical protein